VTFETFDDEDGGFADGALRIVQRGLVIVLILGLALGPMVIGGVFGWAVTTGAVSVSWEDAARPVPPLVSGEELRAVGLDPTEVPVVGGGNPGTPSADTQ